MQETNTDQPLHPLKQLKLDNDVDEAIIEEDENSVCMLGSCSVQDDDIFVMVGLAWLFTLILKMNGNVIVEIIKKPCFMCSRFLLTVVMVRFILHSTHSSSPLGKHD